jgi:Flp pilus assembly protein TadB
MMESCEQKKPPFIRFERSVSVGNLLTMLVLAAAVFAWATTVEKIQAVHEIRLNEGDRTNMRLANEIAANRADIKESLREIKDELREISRHLRVSVK